MVFATNLFSSCGIPVHDDLMFLQRVYIFNFVSVDVDLHQAEAVCNGINVGDSIVGGHGGGDAGIVEDLYKHIMEDYDSEDLSKIDISAMYLPKTGDSTLSTDFRDLLLDIFDLR